MEYDPSDLASTSALITQALPQCPPDLGLLEGKDCILGMAEIDFACSSDGVVSCDRKKGVWEES